MSNDSTCDVKLVFLDGGDPIHMRDKDLLKHMPLIVRAITSQFPNWETEDVVVADPIHIPFSRELAEFLFRHVRQYVSPDDRTDSETTLDHYPEAAQKTVEELKPIIELANFLECSDFVKCIGFVIALKMKDWDVARIAEYMGLTMLDHDDGYDEDNEWMQPPPV